MKTIKRILSLCLSALLFLNILAVPPKAHAATADSKAGVVTTAGSSLNVRSSASTGASKVTALGNRSYVTLISRSGSWWKVEYARGRYGYCHTDYISPVSGNAVTVNTLSGNLNVRSGAGTSYSKTGSVSKGETVIVLSASGDWSKVLYHGTKTGYVSSQYLSTTYTSISLSVPSFKQTDTRWAATPVGESGKTMAQIGCATTAIAMLESHRTGTVIYPNAMAEQLRYTPSGSVYWPSHYTAVTNSSGYLNTIYNLLKQGKPVLFGARNASGKQHWVIVRGYSGGNSLIPAGFTILDPGSNSRSNLQQFLDLYPIFYKYFHC